MTCPGASGRTPHLAAISREAYVYLGAGAAVLLQMAHPGVGRGVARHSTTLARPFDRLRTTMTYVYVVTLGTDAEREAVARMIDRVHAPVRGPGYSAFDPGLQLWVAATLYRGALDLRCAFEGGPGPAHADALHREAALYGTTLQVRPEMWPADRAAFEAYWARTLAAAEVLPEVRDYAQRLLSGRDVPWPARLAMPLQRLATAALLPASLREAYGLPWSERDARRWARFLRIAPRVYRWIPAPLRHLPARLVLADMRRRRARGRRVI
ncbi:oxygenase MpaB family protein [Coralloluteibacterium stylophorae]|uniref:DUF2236 domain-containing protein n=1 Tax=Coralloluteibacterium stylophorae TaxID=1776034 RepID=A0A8J7VUM1_9GAMM|nr:oxygenase MpaB family protein [Coralloluteibacterium stylophorae]MBS7457229.1 DUF2236 domain-containing protein [Coralloluteibacterium stylophorae]